MLRQSFAGRWSCWILVLALGLSLASSVPNLTQSRGKEKPTVDSKIYEALRAKAETHYGKGEYSQAADDYQEALKVAPKGQERWVRFRVADATWRGERAAIKDPNAAQEFTSQMTWARQTLEGLTQEPGANSQPDQTSAECQESLGDFFTQPGQGFNWNEAWPHYQAALDWWAGSTDIATARKRYLILAFKCAKPFESGVQSLPGNGAGPPLPLSAARGALKISESDLEKAHAQFLVAMALVQSRDASAATKTIEAFEGSLPPGRQGSWYAASLYWYALWSTGQGAFGTGAGADCGRAVMLFKRLTTEFKEKETSFYPKALAWLDEHGRNTLQPTVSSIFLPGAMPDFTLRYLRQKKVHFALYPVDLARVALQKVPGQRKPGDGHWTDFLDLSGVKPAHSWDKEFSGPLTCDFLQERITMDWAPPAGAYVLEAAGVGSKARELILVTDMALVVKRSGHKVLVYACGAIDGSPVAGARVRLLGSGEGDWHAETVADQDGIARFDLPQSVADTNIVALASNASRQAFALSRGPAAPSAAGAPIFYALTDRPAYRPGDKVQWKLTMRRQSAKDLSTPSGERIAYVITDPRQTKIKEGFLTLNAFGSAWDSLTLNAEPALGEYRIAFHGVGRKTIEGMESGESSGNETPGQDASQEVMLPSVLGEATLFRVEEYKLPEFRVTVRTAEGEKPGVFRPTEPITALIQANYYSGEAVGDADVEVAVYQQSFARIRRPFETVAWMDEGQTRGDYAPPSSQPIRRETVKTDESGHAEFTFQPPDSQQDVAYTIQARVTDASRRMVPGDGQAIVSRRSSYADLSTGGMVFRVGEAMTVRIRVSDIYGNPQSAKGTLALSRTVDREIWLDPDGKKVEGELLKKAKAFFPKFPPPPQKQGARGWTLSARYPEEVKVLTKEVVAGASGEASATFSLEKEGTYDLRWSDSLGNSGGQGEQASLLVVGTDAQPLRLTSGGFQIILSKSMVKPGERARALIISNLPKVHILFGLSGVDLHGFRVARLTGTAAIVDLETTDGDSPCAYLSADMVSDLKLYSTSQRITVPALHRALTVKLEPDREEYTPRQQGTWRVTTLNAGGKPVSAEVSLGVVDDSVYAIQRDYARDPRSVFLVWQRPQLGTTASAFDLAYIKPPPKLLHPSAGAIPTGFTGSGIRGRITDEAGQPVVGAMVQVTGISLQGFRGAATGTDGVYAVALPPGSNYQVKVEAPGYNTVVRKGIGVEPESVTQLPFTLSQGKTEIVVTAAAPMIDVKKTEVGASISDKMISSIPLGRSAEDLMFLAPGAVSSGEESPNVVVRHDFSATALWQPDVVTDGSGLAVVRLAYPETLTGWRATARASTAGNEFGADIAEVRTRQDLTVRLQSPRFLIAGDTAVISALIQNSGQIDTVVTAELKAEGVQIQGAARAQGGVHVPAKGSARVDWQVIAGEPGHATFEVQARGTHASDAMARAIPILAHGIEVLASATGHSSRGDLVLSLNLPMERYPKSTSLEIQISPGPASAALDALPYLIGYPYGCTEQTMSRFLPCVVVAKALKEQGLSPEAAAGRIFGPGAHDAKMLDDMVDKGLTRLYGFHHPDGGWGWWEHDASDPFMTAYVLGGLCIARSGGIKIPDDVLRQGQEFLLDGLSRPISDDDLAAWMLYAVATCQTELSRGNREEVTSEEPEQATETLKDLWSKRATLTSYGQALLVLSAYQLGREDWAKDLARDLAKASIKETSADGQRLAFWGQQGSWWQWSLSPTETTAFALRALLVADPINALCEQAAAWLLAKRTGPQWSNTRDTALAVLALNDYLVHTHERMPAGSLDVHLNGHRVKGIEIGGGAFALDGSTFTVDPAFIRDGVNEIRVSRKSGSGSLFASALARFYSQEEPVKAAGAGLSVVRIYTLLKRLPTLLKGDIIDRQEVKDGAVLTSGDRVECMLTLTADHDADYVLIEDSKPAGFESLQIRSGEQMSARSLPDHAQALELHQELKDTKVALFLDHIPKGSWEIRYELVAEAPGTYHAMPAEAHAMYAPHLKCNSDEIRLTVKDRPVSEGTK